MFPAKKKVSNAIHSWLDRIATNETPVLIGVLSIPVNIVLDTGEKLTGWLLENAKLLLIGICSIVMTRIAYFYVPSSVFSSMLGLVVKLHSLFDKIVDSLNLTVILLAVATYIVCLLLLWNESSSKAFNIGGQCVWMLVVAYGCSFLGSFKTSAFVCAMIYGIIGYFYELDITQSKNQVLVKLKKLMIREKAEDQTEVEVETLLEESVVPTTRVETLMRDKLNLSEIKQRMQLNIQEKKSLSPPKKKEIELESDFYIKILVYACIATVLWKQVWILLLSIIPICIYAAKELVKILGFFKYCETQYNHYYAKFHEWLEPRRNAVVPVCFPGVMKMNSKVHKIFCQNSKLYVDDISAVSMILFLIFFVLFLSIFLFFQIYAETITVAQLGSDLINRTLTHSPELVEMLPLDMQSMNDAIDNAYKYSREKIEEYVDNMLNQTNPEQAEKLKIQILSLWDRLIQSYMDRNNDSVGPRVGFNSVLTTLDEIFVTSERLFCILDVFCASFNLYSFTVTAAGLFSWMKSNVGLLTDVGDSIWLVLKANMSLLFSTTTTLFSVVFGGGQAMIKFLFNTVS